MIRKFLTFFAAVSALAACGTSGASNETAADVTLTVWSWQTAQADLWEEIFEAFEREHPHINVEYRGIQSSEYDTVLRTAMQGGDGPDLPFLRSYGGVQAMAAGGDLVTLDEHIPELAGWGDAILSGGRGSDGQLYGVPFALQTTQIFYNKQLFDEHGLEPPQTWDDFVEIHEQLEEAGVIPFSAAYQEPWMLSHYLAIVAASQYGGADLEERLLSGATTYEDPDYVRAVSFFDDFVDAYLPAEASGMTVADAQTMFQAGQAAMHPAGTWTIEQYNETPGLEVGLFPMPPGSGALVDEPLTPGYVDGAVGLNADSEHQEEAIELLAWLTTEEFGTLFMDKLVQPSVVPGVEASDPLLAEALANYRENPTPFISYAAFSGGSPDGQSLEQDNLQRVLLGEITPEEAAANLASGIGQWFTPREAAG